jgi:hypothetical protein
MFSMKKWMRPIALSLAASMAAYWPLSVSAMAQSTPGQPVPSPTPAQILQNQADIFTELFGQPFDPDNWTYPLVDKVVGEGEYDGVNHLGQPFTLNVLLATPVDIATLTGVAPRDKQWAIDNGFEYVGVIGTLSTSLTTIPISGLAVFQSNAAIPFDSRLIVSGKEDPSNPIFDTEVEELGGGGIVVPILIPVLCPDPACVEACHDAFEDCVDEAEQDLQDALDAGQADYDAAKASAGAAKDAAIAPAVASFNAAKDSALNTIAVAMSACVAVQTAGHIYCAVVTAGTWWTLGLSTAACMIGVTVLGTACRSTAMANYFNEIGTAQGIYDAAVADAMAQYEAAMDAAQSALEGAAAAAQSTYDQAIADCETALEDCLDGCPTIICDWIVIFVYLSY